MSKYENEIQIIFDKDSMDRYNAWYLKNNHRSKKPPIENPSCISLNTFVSKVRMHQNGLKQKWKEYTKWRLNDLGIHDLNIEKCEMEYLTILPSKRKFDVDNSCIASKFTNDGITESGLNIWKDDSYDIVDAITFKACYIKDVRELHITIRY